MTSVFTGQLNLANLAKFRQALLFWSILPVCSFVCLSVCLSVYRQLHVNTGLFIKILPEMYLWTRKNLTFGSLPHLDPDPRIYLKDSSTLWDSAFSYNLSRMPISGRTGRIFVNILSQMYLLTKKSQLNFGRHPDSKSAEPDRMCLGGGLQLLFL